MPAPWFINYRPTRFTELCFSCDAHIRTLQWLRNKRRGMLHITGPSGCGKTVLVYAAAKALKYNVVEISGDRPESMKESIPHSGRALNNRQNLLLVDESSLSRLSPSADIHILLSHAKYLPVILTSTDMQCKEIETIRIARPGLGSIQRMVDLVYKRVPNKCAVDTGVIVKLAEQCSFDMRAVLNYCQLYSKQLPTPYALQNVDHAAVQSLFFLCDKLFKRRIRMLDIDNVYNARLLNICLNSLFITCRDADFIAQCLIKASSASELPSAYHFLELDQINQYRGGFIYEKEGLSQRDIDACNMITQHSEGQDVRFFIMHISRSRSNGRYLRHIQQILRRLEPEELSPKDLEILNAVEMETFVSASFKYKYNAGASNAVRREVSLEDVLRM